MKIINDRYELRKKMAEEGNTSFYLARDRFKSKAVLLRIFDTMRDVLDKFASYHQLIRVKHPSLLEYYNYEKVWFFDEKMTYSNYYILISEYVSRESFAGLLEKGIFSEDEVMELMNHFWKALFYLYKQKLYIYDFPEMSLIIQQRKRLKIDLLGLDVSSSFESEKFSGLCRSIAGLLETYPHPSKRLDDYRSRLSSFSGASLEVWFDEMEAAGFFKENRYAYFYEKKEWTACEMGLSLHSEILRDLYTFQSRRNSKIAFIFFGDASSLKEVVIRDFLEFLKYEKYLKIEIIMQDFYDFLKYLFECVSHYRLREDLNKIITRQFGLYNETLNEQYLLNVQSYLLELLFDFSITKKVVLHVQNLVGMDDKINRFLNMMLHVKQRGNIVFLFDAGMEKNRFHVFYKDPRFEIVTKEYSRLSHEEVRSMLAHLFDNGISLEPLENLLLHYEINRAEKVIGFIQKMVEKNLLSIDDKHKILFINSAGVEKALPYLLADDSLDKKVRYLRREEKEILWYLSHSRKIMKLDELISLLQCDQEEALAFLGSLRAHAYIDEIWEQETAYYRIVRNDLKEYFLKNSLEEASDFREKFIVFLENQKADPLQAMNLIQIHMELEAYSKALENISRLLKIYHLGINDMNELQAWLDRIGREEGRVDMRLYQQTRLHLMLAIGDEKGIQAFVSDHVQLKQFLKEKAKRLFSVYLVIRSLEGFIGRGTGATSQLRRLKRKIERWPENPDLLFLMHYIDYLVAPSSEKESRGEALLNALVSGMPWFLYQSALLTATDFYVAGSYERVRRQLESFLSLLETEDTSDELSAVVIQAFFLMGNINLNTGDASKALGYYERALEMARDMGSYRDQIKAHNNIASAKYYIGYSYETIIYELNKSVNLGKKSGDEISIVVPLSNIAELYADNFYYKEAYKTIAEAMRYVKKSDARRYLVVLDQLIAIIIQMGDYKKARYLSSLMKKSAKSANYWQYLVNYYANNGDIYYAWRRYAQALSYYERVASECEKQHLYNYEYFDAMLKKVRILYFDKGRKTEARNLFQHLKKLKESSHVELGDIDFDYAGISFLQSDDEKITMLERLLARYKKEKNNGQILRMLIELSQLYEKREFNFRLYEILTDILFYEQHIKSNFPNGYLVFYQKTRLCREIQDCKRAVAQRLKIPLSRITFPFIKKLWSDEYADNIFRFYRKEMLSLIERWKYDFTGIDENIKIVLNFIMDFARADRVTLFVRNETERYHPLFEQVARPLYEEGEYRNDLLVSALQSPRHIHVKNYSHFSSSIVTAGLFPVVDLGYSEEGGENGGEEALLEDSVRGLIYIDTKKYCNHIQKGLAEFIFPLIQYLSILLRYRELRDEIILCPLTGVMTRYFFLNTLKKKIARRRKDETLGFMLVDIDHMTELNQKFGEIEGDRIIKRVAGVIASYAKSNDIIGRYMGEEFAIAHSRISKGQLLDKAEHLIKLIKEDSELARYGATVSIGLSYIPDHGEKADIVLAKGIAALNAAKKSDRAVVLWEEKYGIYKGKHDILAGIVTGDIALTEDVIRNLVELAMLAPESEEVFFQTILGMISRFIDYDFIDFSFAVRGRTFQYRDKGIKTIEKYVEHAGKIKDTLIAINWKYEEGRQGLYSDLIHVEEERGVFLKIYLSSPMEKKEYTYIEANLLSIVTQLIISHLRYLAMNTLDE
jgi:diguanylate cyclase (GGDEF)-like protein